MTSSRRNITISVLLCVAVAVVYFPAARYGFMAVDDPQNISANVDVHDGLSRAAVHWAMTGYLLGHWTPLVRLSYLADQSLFHLDPGVMHLEDIAWHAAGSMMLFFLLLSATGAAYRSATVAVLFAVHPMHVESVVWLTERRDVMSTFFLFAAIWSYVQYSRERTTRWKQWYGLAILLYATSLASKAMGITLPALLLLLDLWPLKRATTRWEFLKRIPEKIPFLVMAATTAFVAMQAQRAGGAATSVDALSISSRLENIGVTFPGYILKLAIPTDLAVFYPHPGDRPVAVVAAGFGVLAVVTLVAVGQWKRRRYLIVGWLWFLIALLPVSGLAQSGPQAMADRYSYVPSVGLFMSVVWFVADVAAFSTQRQRFATGVTAAVIFIFGMLANRQVCYWCDSDTLFRHALEATGNNWFAHWGLGNLARDRGDLATAADEYHRSIADREVNYEAYAALGDCWRSSPVVAIRYYRKAVEYAPHLPKYRVALAAMLTQVGALEEADGQLRAALVDDPTNPDALAGLKDVRHRLQTVVGHEH